MLLTETFHLNITLTHLLHSANSFDSNQCLYFMNRLKKPSSFILAVLKKFKKSL